MLVTLAKFLDPWEAYIVQALLKADGVPATVAFANHAIIDWPMTLALGGTAVQVPADCLAESQEIFSRYQAGTLEAELNEVVGLEPEHCPLCGSTNFKRTMPWRKRLYAALVVLVFAPFPTKRSLFVCKSCGHHWEWGEA
jgi:hypothetical protein